MKKSVKTILWCVIIINIAVIWVCWAVMPDKMNGAMELLGEILNKPITVAGVTVTLGGVFGYLITKYIFTNTKFGKRELCNMRDEINTFKEDVKEDSKRCEDKVNNALVELNTKANEYQESLENRATVLINQFDDLQNNVINALETIPNKKVQGIVTEYKAKYEEKKAEFMQKAIDGNKYIDEKLAEFRKEFDELLEKVHNEKEIEYQTTEE